MIKQAWLSIYLLVVLTSFLTGDVALATAQKAEELYPSVMPFDVVSIRLNGPSGASYSWNNTPSSFSASSVRVKSLIARASGMAESRIEGADSWPSTDLYTLSAKSESDVGSETSNGEGTSAGSNEDKSERAKSPVSQPSDAWDATPHDLEERIFRVRLNMILASRFKMRTHLETKVKSYSVLMANPQRFSLSTANEDSCKNPYVTLSGKSHCVSMTGLSEILAFVVGDIVVNRTNLDGKYDVSLPAIEGNDRSATSDHILSALHTLGLDVKTERGPLQMLVVDHLERPTAN